MMKIKHDKDNRRYMLVVSEGFDDNAVVLRYRQPDAGSIHFTSTFTPQNLRGQGLARKVVEHALDEADSQGLEVTASCWYVEKILQERKQQASA